MVRKMRRAANRPTLHFTLDMFPVKKPRSKKQREPQSHEIPTHIGIYNYLMAVVPPDTAKIWHTPNGVFCGPKEAAKLLRMGMLPGVADLAILTARATAYGRLFFLEVKTKSGKLSKEQKEFRDFCDMACVPYVVVRSIDDARAFLLEHGIQTREVQQNASTTSRPD